MAGKRFVPIKLGQRDKRPAWLAAYSSWRLVFYSLALTLLLAGVGGVLVVWRQPHILQGDARWAEVRALFVPAVLAGSLTLAAILLLVVKTIWPALAALARSVVQTLQAGWAAVAWAAKGLGSVLAWLGDAMLWPAVRSLFFLLRISANWVVRVLLQPAGAMLLSAMLGLRALLGWGRAVMRAAVRWVNAWVFGPVRRLLDALTGNLIQPMLQQLLRALARMAALFGRGMARLVSVLTLFVGSVVVRPLRWMERVLVWLALRLVQGVAGAIGPLSRSLAAAARGAGWLLARLGRGLGLAGWAAVQVALAGLRGALRLLGHSARAVWVGGWAVARRLTLAAQTLRAWYRARSQGQVLVILSGGVVVCLAVGLALVAGLVWAGLPQSVSGLALVLIFAPTVALALGLVAAMGRVIRSVVAHALAWVGWALARVAEPAGRLAHSLLRLIIRRPLWFVLDLGRRAAPWVGRALVGLGRRLARQVLVPLGAGLRAAAALGVGLVVAMGVVVARARAWVGWTIARVVVPVGRAAGGLLQYVILYPLWLASSVVTKAIRHFLLALLWLPRRLFRLVLAPVGRGLRAATAFVTSTMRAVARSLLTGLQSAGQTLVRLVIMPVVGFGLKSLRTVLRWLFLPLRALLHWLRKPLVDQGLSIPVANLGLITAGVVLFLGGRTILPPVACRLGVLPMCPPAPCAAPDGAVLVSFFSSNTKEDWIDTVTAAFNAGQHTTASGKPIFVCVTHGNSGGQQLQLRDGQIEPIAWSPGDQSWVDGINQLWQDRHGQPLVSSLCPPTVISPIGFAMWRSMAEAMGWPERRISWDDLVELAADPQGWGRYGHPEWGAFKFGHTHPDQSNSGLLILTALAHDLQNQTAPLSVEQVDSEDFVAAMRDLELNTYHYGIQSRDLIGLMINLGQDYLHAVNTTETETLRTNQRRKDELPQPLAFIFPGDGTYWTEQPYCVLEAEWVSDEQREAAHLYGDYLRAPAQQALAPAYYLRPLDPSLPLGSLFTLENGTDPRVTPNQVPALESPGADVAAMVKDIFHRTKKKATIVILLDVSGSMQGEPMTSAIAATIAFLRQLDRDDEVYVYAFGDGVSAVGSGGPARDVEEPLSEALNSLTAAGGTALYDAVCQGSQQIGRLRAEHEAAGEARLYGVVLLSDGDDTVSSATEAAMRACLVPSGPQRTKFFAIQYGQYADEEVLADIASRTLGKLFVAEASDIANVYLAISAEQ